MSIDAKLRLQIVAVIGALIALALALLGAAWWLVFGLLIVTEARLWRVVITARRRRGH